MNALSEQWLEKRAGEGRKEQYGGRPRVRRKPEDTGRILEFFFGGGNSRMSGKPLEFWEHPREPNSSSVVHRPIASALLRKLLEMQNPGHAPKCQASIYHTTKFPRDEQHNEVRGKPL